MVTNLRACLTTIITFTFWYGIQ